MVTICGVDVITQKPLELVGNNVHVGNLCLCVLYHLCISTCLMLVFVFSMVAFLSLDSHKKAFILCVIVCLFSNWCGCCKLNLSATPCGLIPMVKIVSS